jgi:hypothetical protein
MTTENPAITRDVKLTHSLSRQSKARFELAFDSDDPAPTFTFCDSTGIANIRLCDERYDALETLLRAGREHQSQLRYDREAEERRVARETDKHKAEQEVKAAAEIADSDPASATADFIGDDES